MTSAGIPHERLSFEYYVDAYRALASVGGFETEELWRTLWVQAPGDVRAHFVASTDGVRRRHGGTPLTRAQAAQLRRVGDTVWGEAHYYDRPAPDLVTRFWESAFR